MVDPMEQRIKALEAQMARMQKENTALKGQIAGAERQAQQVRQQNNTQTIGAGQDARRGPLREGGAIQSGMAATGNAGIMVDINSNKELQAQLRATGQSYANVTEMQYRSIEASKTGASASVELYESMQKQGEQAGNLTTRYNVVGAALKKVQTEIDSMNFQSKQSELQLAQNQTAWMHLGDAQGMATKVMNDQINIYGDNAQQAIAVTGGIREISEKLWLDPVKTLGTYNQLQQNLLYATPQQIEETKKLLALQRSSGVEAGNLAKMKEGFMDYESAAMKVQVLNATMRGANLNATDLMMSTHSEVAQKIHKGMVNSGMKRQKLMGVQGQFMRGLLADQTGQSQADLVKFVGMNEAHLQQNLNSVKNIKTQEVALAQNAAATNLRIHRDAYRSQTAEQRFQNEETIKRQKAAATMGLSPAVVSKMLPVVADFSTGMERFKGAVFESHKLFGQMFTTAKTLPPVLKSLGIESEKMQKSMTKAAMAALALGAVSTHGDLVTAAKKGVPTPDLAPTLDEASKLHTPGAGDKTMSQQLSIINSMMLKLSESFTGSTAGTGAEGLAETFSAAIKEGLQGMNMIINTPAGQMVLKAADQVKFDSVPDREKFLC